MPAHVSHSFAGAALLDELSGPLGFALWQSFRDVQLWSHTSPRERKGLFAPGAARTRAVPLEVNGPDSELRAPMRALLAMVEDAPGTQPEEVARACAAIARWAEARGAMASALAFAEAAAGVCAEDAALALDAGRLARRRGEWGRAETWFLRSAGLGRRSGDWGTYARSFLGMGKVHQVRGNTTRARKHFLRAMRTARRQGLHEFEGRAMHDLMVLHFASGDFAGAEAWGREAYRLYGPQHPELPYLAHDLAVLWTASGDGARAAAVIRALLPHFPHPTERVQVLASLVRATGGMRDRAGFEEAWSEAWKLATGLGALGVQAQCMLDMAHGAAALGDERKARRAALRCLEFAAGLDEPKTRLEAEELLQRLEADGTHPPIPSRDDLPQDVAGDAFAKELIVGLDASTRT